MRATALRKKGAASFEALKPACRLVILHEDFSAYADALEVCRRIMERFANELDFDLKSWSLIELADPNGARHAAKAAGAADILLLAMRTAQSPTELDQWLGFYFTAKSKPEGVLALVTNAADKPPLALDKLVSRLEPLAKRLGMDFISLHPDDDEGVRAVRPVARMPEEARE